jgi:hypothetical protein
MIMKKSVFLVGIVAFLLGVSACQTTAQSESGPGGVVTTAVSPDQAKSASASVETKEENGTETDDSGLGKDLKTLRLVGVFPDNKSVEYVPTGIVLGTGSQRTAGHLLRVPMGARAMLQGVISLSAAQADVDALTERVKARFGAEGVVTLKKPDSFMLKAAINGKTYLTRAHAGGSLEGIPFQAVVDVVDPKKPFLMTVTVEYLLPGFQGRMTHQTSELIGTTTEKISRFGPGIRVIQEVRHEASSSFSISGEASTGETISFEQEIEVK